MSEPSEQPTIASGLRSDQATAEYPTFTGDHPAVDTADFEFEDGADDEWPVRTPAKGVRLGIPAAIIVALLLLAAGFWGGAIAQKNHASASTGGGAAAFAARLRNAASGGNGATSTNGATGGGLQFPGGATGTGASDATTGTISIVDGDTLYVLTASNQLVKVTLTPSTTVTRNAKAKAVGLRPGDTVVVQGAAGKTGTVQASSVAATAKGVSSTSGFGGFGGPGFTPGSAPGGSGQGTPSG
jgi:endonuclease YncB( thermonuclease family)